MPDPMPDAIALLVPIGIHALVGLIFILPIAVTAWWCNRPPTSTDARPTSEESQQRQ